MRTAALSLLRVTVAVAILVLAGAALIVQPVLGSYASAGTERARPERLRADVTTLTTEFRPRSADHPERLEAAAAYIERAFRDAGARVTSQPFTARKNSYRNVIARFGPEGGPPMIVGAHYDAFCGNDDLPGADDNASGTAGILDMGSAVHARSVSDAAGMICLEMIGYYADEQTWPNWTFAALYPSRGDFIAVGGGWEDRGLARHVKRALRGAGMRAWSFTGPRRTVDASDHRNYWQAGIPAVLVTDTAFLRNPHYHTRNDTAATLDYVRMARVVDGVYTAVTHTSH